MVRVQAVSSVGGSCFGNIARTVITVGDTWGHAALLAYDYDSRRKTFTEHFEYPELPLAWQGASADFTALT